MPLSRFFEAITRHGRTELATNGRQFAYCDEIAVAVAIAADRVVKETKDMSGAVELYGEYTRYYIDVEVLEGKPAFTLGVSLRWTGCIERRPSVLTVEP